MIIAIDGPAAAGKTTVAQEVARRLDATFLDTGAMYRAVTLAVLDRGLDPSDAESCARVAREVELSFDESGRIRIDGRPGEPDIRSPRVDRAVSHVSAHAPVREAIVRQQRQAARARERLVAEGRDTTTVVFPEADHKFFLNASSSERADRRARQTGVPERVDAIRAELEERDRLDGSRAHSPLVQAADAIEIDTEGRTLDEVVARIVAAVAQGVDSGSPGAGRGR